MKHIKKPEPSTLPEHWMLSPEEIRNAVQYKAAQYEYFKEIFKARQTKLANN